MAKWVLNFGTGSFKKSFPLGSIDEKENNFGYLVTDTD
jgi:hypothetical protein